MNCPACGLGISYSWTTYKDKPGLEFCARAWCKFFRHRGLNSSRAHYVIIGLIVAGSVTALVFLLTECP